MSTFHSDALDFFGAIGDQAYKKIFPALQAMVKGGHLSVPIIGVAKAGGISISFGRGHTTAYFFGEVAVILSEICL
jgi:glucose-6-phosphate 1-dehydrogenase